MEGRGHGGHVEIRDKVLGATADCVKDRECDGSFYFIQSVGTVSRGIKQFSSTQGMHDCVQHNSIKEAGISEKLKAIKAVEVCIRVKRIKTYPQGVCG